MDTAAQIEKLLCNIRRRNRREIIVGFIILPVFGFFAAITPVGSLAFFGHLLILVAILFVIGMICFVASPRGDLSSHSIDEVQYWRNEILRQAKLLRLVPLWYLLPFLPGMILLFWSMRVSFALISIPLIIVIVIFGLVTWLNLKAASKLQQEASTLK
ncbi:MAG: hypothetical protein QME07_02280 [bacterium]|nr:hypothetical protein [bacterium]